MADAPPEPATSPQLYRPRAAEHTVLYRIVREHLATFLRTAAEHHDGGLPAFVEQEFRDFLTCGVWSRGFARFRCDACHAERLVPFSCKGRVCPSCGGRRMAERAAHLVDHVLPAVPIRQWVLSLPHRLRYLLAWDHGLCRAVLRIYARALLAFLRRRARRQGIADGRSGAVTAIQRFGSAVNCNVHYHTLVPDGVFAPDASGALHFVGLPAPTDHEVARLLGTIARRIERLLRRRGLAPDEDTGAAVDPVAEDAPLLAALSRASVAGQSLLGRRHGAPVLRVGRDPDAPWVTSTGPRHAHLAGFDLHANRTVRADDRVGLEKLCHYLLRPPLAQERLELLPDGRVCCTLAHPWSDGTRAFLFEPLEFLEKLAVLIPRPRINLLLYHGIFAAHARERTSVVGPSATHDDTDRGSMTPAGPATEVPRAALPPRKYYAWADLMRRVFAIDILACACGGRLRFIATIEDPVVVQRILRHVGLPTDTPAPAAARQPPGPEPAFAFPA